MGPLWDMDISCGNINYDGCQDPEGFWVNKDQWYKRLFEDEYFAEKVAERWNETKQKLISSFDWLENESKNVKPFVMLNDSVWHNLGRRQWPHAPGWKNRKTYESEVDYMTDFLKKRAQWMSNEYSGN